MRFEARIAAASLAALSVLVALCVMSFRELQQSSTTGKWVAHTYEVLTTLEATLGSVVSAESRLRGFLLTGDEAYLQRRNADLARCAESMANARVLTRDNPDQQQRLDRLQRSLDDRLVIMNEAIAHRRANGADAGLASILDRGRLATNRVRDTVAEMEQKERELLESRKAQAAASAAATGRLILGGGILDGLLFAFAVFTIHREMRTRKGLEDALRRDADRLSALVKTQAEIVETELDLQKVLDIVTNRAQRLTRAAGASIDLLEGDRLVQKSATGTAASTYELRRKIFSTLSADCLRRDEAIICEDVESSNGGGGPKPEGAGSQARSAILVPLRSGSNVVGVLKVFSDKVHGFEKTDAQTLELIAGLIAHATTNAAAFAGRQELIEELTGVNEELEAFSYSVSHDLRAPLRHIHGFADLLRKHIGENVDATGARYLGIIGDSAKKMGVLIDDLLAFSRIGRAQIQLTRIDLRSLVQQVIDDHRADVEGREVDWMVGALPAVDADASMLRQVVVNLLDNALKYTRRRELAIIEIDAKREDGETIVWVRDNGVGFDPQYAGKLFGVFERLHNAEEFEGTGIGLANVRRIIQKHGGRTWAESSPGQGATFFFTFPPQKS